MITEFLEIILEIVFTSVTPDRMAKKVKDKDISGNRKRFLIVIYTLIYSLALAITLLTFVIIQDKLNRVFAAILIGFLSFLLVKFYYLILND
ncbi:hypothetical protein [Microaceticoccus formicicus]|uniref:hypothetical protein n=1 Tax=Microaceticoccus formicicus TaxID=3118105 RepID=UPI003CD02FF6|nr:hypothetical protein VZL98_10990 [Peptoniphilaceae bacterium AMB_02]